LLLLTLGGINVPTHNGPPAEPVGASIYAVCIEPTVVNLIHLVNAILGELVSDSGLYNSFFLLDEFLDPEDEEEDEEEDGLGISSNINSTNVCIFGYN